MTLGHPQNDTSNLDHVLSSEEWEKEFDNEVLNHSSLDMKYRQMVISISNKLQWVKGKRS